MPCKTIPATPPQYQTAIQKFVRTIEHGTRTPVTIFTVKAGLPRANVREVLDELRLLYPSVTISCIGNEIAVFAHCKGLEVNPTLPCL